eukprot:Phypoly_transcript_00242.p1 GENE.Phypoly_transcript_00242~~Phypoly_transcript_00242.p1  ORF type:complete len:1865 (+),score=284.20 Phypoly_transcript_00242:114-5708(+)
MEKGFKSQLLFIPFTNILKYLSNYAKDKGSIVKRCAISYTWPITAQEQGLQERILRLADDLKSTGITPFLDLTHHESLVPQNDIADPLTHTETTILSWMRESEAILLIGSPSYKKRAADASTLTYKECKLLSKKSTVIPLLMAGDFPDAFPPGYTGTLGASIVTLGQYFQSFPEVVATLLRIDHYPQVGAALRKYRADTEEILRRADRVHESERTKLVSQIALQHKAWAAKVLICRSHFTPDQQRILDGKIMECERKIDEYCEKVAKEFEKYEVPVDATEGATRSLEDRLEDFLHSEEEKVLLLQAPPGAHKSHASKFLACNAWYERSWVPVLVDLDKIPTIDDQCVSHALKSHQFDDTTISHAQATRKFLLLVEGFDKRGCQVNVYIRCSLKNWKGKVVFTCRSSYIGKSAQGPYYFMPADIHQRPQPTALKIISFVTKASEPLIDENTTNPTEVHKALLSEAAIHKPNRAKENWRKVRDATFSKNVLSPLHKKSFISRYTNEQRVQLRKGYAILQQDIIRPMFVEFLSALSKLKASPKKAFISYAWPVDKSDCTALQMRLLTLVQDMELAGITVLLDILYLHVGVDIIKFMKEGIETSDSIFWIGTPRLVQRIWFNNGVPANPATIEFCHIRDKIQSVPQALRPLHFLGESVATSFPPLNVASPPVPSTLDFRNEKHYFTTLPQLAAAVLGVDEMPEYKRLFQEFCAQIRATEATFTVSSIMQRLDDAAKQLEQEEENKEEQLQQLLGKIPESLRSELAGTKEAQVQAFHSLLAQIQASALSNATLDLDLYIPLKGGAHLDTPSQLYFDVGERVVKFLGESGNKRVMLIQGGAGAGKTLFGRFLERYLWRNLSEGFIPIFVSLSKASDPYTNLVGQVLHEFGLGELDATHLATEKFVFILDGLDELPLEKMPGNGILICNNMLALPNAHFIITSRNHYITALEVKFGVPIHEHLTQQLSLVEDVFMMPFDTAQIQRYLAEYCRTPEAAWDDWKSFWDHIDTIPGLSTLAQTPFMLKLLTISLPRLVVRADMTRQIKNVDVYQAFSEMWFEREMWKQLVQHSGIPPSENRVAGYLGVARLLGQTMFARGVTTIPSTQFRLPPSDQLLLSGLPVVQQAGNISFIHKSVQEFFTAFGWISALPTTDIAQTILGARLASTEAGLLKFVAQMYDYTKHHAALIDIVLASRGSEEVGVPQIAAANAMTILNSVKFSFSGMDLSSTNIQGAILDSALMHKTNLSHANLTDVSLRQAWLDGADLSHASLLRAWFDHRSEVMLPDKCSKVAATPDGFVAVTVKSYICEHNGRTSHISSSNEIMSVATQGYLVCMGTATGNIILWSLLTAGPVFPPVNRHSGIVQCLVLTGTHIVSGGYDCKICICNRERGQVLNVLKGHRRRVNAITVLDQTIISGSADGTIRFWDLEVGTQLREIVTSAPIQCMVVCDGMLITGTEHGPIQVWNQATGTFMNKLEGHAKGVKCITYIEGKIISGSADATVRIWDMTTSKEAEVLQMSNPVASVLVRVGNLVIGCEDNAVQVWDMSMKPQLEIEENEREYTAIKRCFVAHGKLFLVSAAAVQIVDVLSQNVEEFSRHSKTVKHLVAYENDIISWGGEFLRWSPTTREVRGAIPTGTLDVSFVEIFEDSLIVGGYEGLSVLDITTGMTRLVIPRPILAMSVDATTKLAAFYAEEEIELLDLVSEEIVGILPLEDGLIFLKCHQGKLLVPPPFDNEISVWDLKTRTKLGTLCGHTASVQQLDAHEGRVATSDGRNVRLWDLETCQCLCSMEVPEPTKSIALAAKWLATVSKGSANAVKWWKPDAARGQLFLLGVMPGGWPLTMRGCLGEGVQGISRKQRKLFRYLGATGLTVF